MGGRAAPQTWGYERVEGRRKVMPLNEFQRVVLGVLSRGRAPDRHLAGGAVLHKDPTSPRFTRDLDLFHDREELVGSTFLSDSKRLQSNGYHVELTLSQPGYIRAIVSCEGQSTRVDWAHDSAWRFMPPQRIPNVGHALHPVDISVNKVLALAGRDEPRDFLDINYINREIISLGALCWAACGKDPGFSPTMLLESLARKGRIRQQDIDRLELAAPIDVETLKREWIGSLEAARKLVRSLPAEEAGCLYWQESTRKFVTPNNGGKLRRHFATEGGVIPQVAAMPFLTSTGPKRGALKRSYRKPKDAARGKPDEI